jgi:hypothetical protein
MDKLPLPFGRTRQQMTMPRLDFFAGDDFIAGLMRDNPLPFELFQFPARRRRFSNVSNIAHLAYSHQT